MQPSGTATPTAMAVVSEELPDEAVPVGLELLGVVSLEGEVDVALEVTVAVGLAAGLAVVEVEVIAKALLISSGQPVRQNEQVHTGRARCREYSINSNPAVSIEHKDGASSLCTCETASSALFSALAEHSSRNDGTHGAAAFVTEACVRRVEPIIATAAHHVAHNRAHLVHGA